MPEYQIWMEGYQATGEHGDAKYLGLGSGDTFRDAVLARTDLNLDKDHEGNFKLSIWACRLFDNEADARKSFG